MVKVERKNKKQVSPPESDQTTESTRLGFLTQDDFLTTLRELSNKEKKDFYLDKLVTAKPGLGYCIDERPPLGVEELKPGFVGGAAGWMVLFIAFGKDFETSFQLTKELYQKLDWGPLEGHIDDNHGAITSPVELAKRNKGCGFLSVWPQVIEITREIFIGKIDLIGDVPAIPGESFIEAIRGGGGKIVGLKGEHKTNEACVVVNFKKGMTLDRRELFELQPAFVWDAWATLEDRVREAFNTLAGVNLDEQQFAQIQTAMHLATGLLLQALRLDKGSSNLVLL